MAFLVVGRSWSNPQPQVRDPAGWNASAAAAYLDQRLTWWSHWPTSARDHGTFCVSCHTALPYALARPALRQALGEPGPSPQEVQLLDNVTRRVRMWRDIEPFYPDQTGAGYLKFLSALGDRPASNARLESLFRRFDVSDLDLRRRMRDYSHGMKRKIGLVQALMTDAPVLILDEPTSGLDPLMIEAFCETIDELARAGRTTIFLSSHVLSEVDRVCDRIALIRNGRLVAVRTLSELRLATPRRVTVLFSRPVDAGVALAPDLTIVTREPQRWVIEARGPIGALVAALGHLPVADISIAAFGLEEAILHLFEDRAC
jgi:ABC-type Na+ transport system ATPase subunit NatA